MRQILSVSQTTFQTQYQRIEEHILVLLLFFALVRPHLPDQPIYILSSVRLEVEWIQLVCDELSSVSSSFSPKVHKMGVFSKMDTLRICRKV
jgi:hypothetical protein